MKTNQAWKKQGIELRPGEVIKGKWNRNHYTIQKKLGAGAVGAVYLAKNKQGSQVALKISDQAASITVEVNVLKSLERVRRHHLGPSLYDLDDWKSPLGKTYSFYVMEYVKGVDLHAFIKSRGNEWIGVFMLQLLEDLGNLHETGWVFGDLKPENLLIVSHPIKVRWVDVGGTTKQGRAIKEYTEFYDRGYWGMGTRKAEPGYDLFSFAIIFIETCTGRFEKGANPKQTLFRKLDRERALKPYRVPLKKALLGKYGTAEEMRRELTKIIYEMQQRTRGVRKQVKMRRNERKVFPQLIDAGGLMVLACLYYLFSLLF